MEKLREMETEWKRKAIQNNTKVPKNLYTGLMLKYIATYSTRILHCIHQCAYKTRGMPVNVLWYDDDK